MSYRLKSGNSEIIWRAKANRGKPPLTAGLHRLSASVLLFYLLIFDALVAQNLNSIYSPGDWVTYLNTRFITGISEGNNYVYFGSTNGIIRYHKFNGYWGDPINKSNGLADDMITAIAVDKKFNIVWVGTLSGISRIDETFGTVTNISFDQLALPFGRVFTSIGIGEKSIWLESAAGIIEIDRIGGYFKGKAMLLPAAIKWSGKRSALHRVNHPFFMNDGFEYYNSGAIPTIVDHKLREFDVTDDLIDDLGNYYSGTCGSGAFIGNARVQTLNVSNFGILNNRVTSVEIDDELNMWIGGTLSFNTREQYLMSGYTKCPEEYGLALWNRNENLWSYIETLPESNFMSPEINVIVSDGDRVWFGTNSGVVFHDREESIWRSISAFDGLKNENITDMALFDSMIWVGTNSGLQMIDIVTKKVSEPELLGNLRVKVFDIEADGNNLWIGTTSGAYRVDSEKSVITHYNGFGQVIDPITISGGNVTSIEVFDDVIWLSDDTGISRLIRNSGKADRLPVHPALFRDSVRGMAANADYLWVATSMGLLRYDRVDRSWRIYTTEDGLSSNSVNTLYIEDDYIWIGTDHGLTRFLWNDPGRADN